jgi:hypothetical protein
VTIARLAATLDERGEVDGRVIDAILRETLAAPSAELGNLKNRDVHRLKKIKSWFVAVPLVLCGIDVALEPDLQRVPPSDMGISTPECR